MRYGREEGRLFDTATCWNCTVIYNGNRSELESSSFGLHDAHGENCTQIDPFLLHRELPGVCFQYEGICLISASTLHEKE